MSKVMYVGDPHVKVEDLEDCQLLLDTVLAKAIQYRTDRVVFLGDQHHNMAVVRVEVMEFWHRNLELFKKEGIPVVMLVGNHDLPGDSSTKAHALMGYKSIADIVNEPRVIDGILHVPYIYSQGDFIDICNEYVHCSVAVVHQEFNLAEYENGFFSSTGVDQKYIPQSVILSGHIHRVQSLGKVSYLGSPRWMTASDANDDRFLTIIEHDRDGSVLSKELIPSPCQRIFQVEDHFEQPYLGEIDKKSRYIVDIIGPQSWIEERKARWLGRARVRTSRTDQQIIRLKESEGIEKALIKFANEFISPNGTSSEVLMGMVKERLLETA